MLSFEWTKKHTTILIYTIAVLLISVVLVFSILFPQAILGTAAKIFSAVSPAFYGFAIAYLFSPICNFFDKKMFFRIAEKHERTAHLLSVICTCIFALAIIITFAWILVPQVVNSYLLLETKFEGYLASASEFLDGVMDDILAKDEFGLLPSFIGEGDITDTIGDTVVSMFGFIGNAADRLLKYSSKILTVTARAVISVIFAVYFLIEKKSLLLWTNKVASMLLPARAVVSIKNWLEYTHGVFSSFISGKLINATLITAVNFILFGICGIPYYPIIALITGVTDLIPYFGPFIGAVPCAFIILIADPIKVIWFFVLVLVIQQIDANIVGPKILGEKVGVDSLLIIVAITVGGGLFGIAGMFLSVPVFTVLAHAVSSLVNMRLRKKGLPTYTAAYEKSEEEAAK